MAMRRRTVSSSAEPVRFDLDTHTVHAAGRSWHADPHHTTIEDDWYGELPDWTGDPTYGHRSRRCCIPFESGWSASIIWGSGTSSTNHDAWHRHDPFTEEPSTVEVGVLDRAGDLRMRRQDDGDIEWHAPETYVDDDQLAALLDRLATLPTDHDYGERAPSIDDLYAAARAAGLDIDRPPSAAR
jgi:hypothetical protein